MAQNKGYISRTLAGDGHFDCKKKNRNARCKKKKKRLETRQRSRIFSRETCQLNGQIMSQSQPMEGVVRAGGNEFDKEGSTNEQDMSVVHRLEVMQVQDNVENNTNSLTLDETKEKLLEDSEFEVEEENEESDAGRSQLDGDVDRAQEMYRTVKKQLDQGIDRLHQNSEKVENLLNWLQGRLPEAKHGAVYNVPASGSFSRPLPPEVEEYKKRMSIQEFFDDEDIEMLQEILAESQEERNQLIHLRQQLNDLYLSMSAILARREEVIIMHEQAIHFLRPEALYRMAGKQRKLHTLLIKNLEDIFQRVQNMSASRADPD